MRIAARACALLLTAPAGAQTGDDVHAAEFTPNALTFSARDKTIADLPVDAHMHIALRAPRPLFVSSGRADRGDAWVDPCGMWTAVQLAQPAWALVGEPVSQGDMPPPEGAAQALYPFDRYQHGGGHVPWPAYEAFFAHEARFAGE